MAGSCRAGADPCPGERCHEGEDKCEGDLFWEGKDVRGGGCQCGGFYRPGSSQGGTEGGAGPGLFLLLLAGLAILRRKRV